MEPIPLDGLVARILGRSPFSYRQATCDAELALAFKIRGQTVLDRGWLQEDELDDGEERDEFDERAIHVLGWDGADAMCTGRVVLPPGLPTEAACSITVEPACRVVDVGRMCVAPSHQSREHIAFIGLLCALYTQMRTHGFTVACGMMSPSSRMLVRTLGLSLELLGPERPYWNETRAPVRFDLFVNPEIVNPTEP